MVLQAFVDDGNEILVPAPDYPLWTGAVTLSGGTPVHYRCDEDERLEPRPRRHRVQDHRAHPRPGDHQPEQPDRRRLQRGRPSRGWSTSPAGTSSWSWPTRSTRRSSSTTRVHHHAATLRRRRRAVPDLQRAVQGLPGLRLPRRLGDGLRARSTWPTDFLEGLTLLANMRMCANVPAQHAIQTALGGYQSIDELHRARRPLLRAEQARPSKLLNEIPGVTCVEPRGALYCFPRLDPEVYPIDDDEAVRHRPAAGQEDPRHPRHRLQLVRARPLPAGDAARRRRCSRRRSAGSPSFLESYA